MKDYNKDWGLILRFDDESESYTNGFEAGLIFERITRRDSAIDMPVHAANCGVIEKMFAGRPYNYEISKTEYEEWMHLSARLAPDEIKIYSS